jgi:putative ABC transport system permease protein
MSAMTFKGMLSTSTGTVQSLVGRRGLGLIENALQDLSYGIRVLRKNWGFSFAVIATLALGIGATTAVFSVVYGVTLRPLPYSEPEQLVGISSILPNGDRTDVGAANYLDWRAQNSVFQEIGLASNTNFNITGDGEPERVLGLRHTAGVFRVLGVEPLLGRTFTDEEGQSGDDKVLLSYGLWQRRYAGDPSILGRIVRLNGRAVEIIGIMPASFQYPSPEIVLWTTLPVRPQESRFTYAYNCIARLKPGVSVAQAQQQLSAIQARIAATDPRLRGQGVYVTRTLDDLVGNVRTPLYLLMGAVLCLLLIGCANLANLLVARSMTRVQELVVRAALGAGKARLILQSFMEVVPLVVWGGAGGLLLAAWMLDLLVPLLPATMPRQEAIRMDWQVLLFAAVLLALTALCIGIWPALQMMRWNISQALRESGRGTTAGGSAARLRSVLVVAQIGAVVILMVVSALLIRSFGALRSVDPGFRSNNILSLQFVLSETDRASNAAFSRFVKQILDRVSALPGVISAGMVNRIPLTAGTQTGGVAFEGSDLPRNAQGAITNFGLDWRTATPDYFRTLGIPLIEGRFFDESDTGDRPLVAIIDERAARRVWPNQSAIGKRVRIGDANAPWYEIVGVVGHILHDGLDIEQRPQIYWNYHQRPQPRMGLTVRTAGDPKQLIASVISAIHEVYPEQPVYDVRSMDEVVERSISQEWLTTALLSLFASIALVLASIGIYGVLSYSVGLRAREIGIRMALGSESRQIVWMVVRQGAALAASGAVIGIAGSLLLARVLAGLLFGIRPTDALSFVSAAGVFFIVALIASAIPARRASKVDPMIALRQD